MIRKFLSLALLLAALATCFSSCADRGGTDTSGLAGTYDITVWVSEKEGVAAEFRKQIAAFEKKYPDIVIRARVEGVTEAEAASKVVADVATAPDLYCFAQDQLARLVQAAALLAPGEAAKKTVRESHDAGAVAAATVGDTVWAYPLSADNGYFMYYDTSIISKEEADSLEAVAAACEKSGKKLRFALENAYYTASFFFATGCRSDWSMDTDGRFTGVTDTFRSPEGLVAMKGMRALTSSPAYDSDADIFTDAGAIVTGVWNADAAKAHFGSHLGATDLPSFTVDGKSYHLGSFSGYKLLGIKPQADAKRGAVLSLLAQYLTDGACQLERFELFGWGPSHKTAQASDAVRADLSLSALAKQSAYAKPQGQIHGSWWDIARVLGADAKSAQSDQALEGALASYDAAVRGLIR